MVLTVAGAWSLVCHNFPGEGTLSTDSLKQKQVGGWGGMCSAKKPNPELSQKSLGLFFGWHLDFCSLFQFGFFVLFLRGSVWFFPCNPHYKLQ